MIETSAACYNAEERKSAPKGMAFRTSPVTVDTARAAAGSTGPARPMALGFVCAIRFGGGASKAVTAVQQSASFMARAMRCCSAFEALHWLCVKWEAAAASCFVWWRRQQS